MPNSFRLVLFFGCLSACTSTQTAIGKDYAGFTETGQASYYADKYRNQQTASGELYQHDLKTAAHKKLPFGTRVRVKNLSNGRTVVVTINDRGPFVKGRIIDLSKSAFSHIGDTDSGVIDVKIKVIQLP